MTIEVLVAFIAGLTALAGFFAWLISIIEKVAFHTITREKALAMEALKSAFLEYYEALDSQIEALRQNYRELKNYIEHTEQLDKLKARNISCKIKDIERFLEKNLSFTSRGDEFDE